MSFGPRLGAREALQLLLRYLVCLAVGHEEFGTAWGSPYVACARCLQGRRVR